MEVPNAKKAIVEIEKLRDYCLSESHPRGKHKARVFASALGITKDDAAELCSAMLVAVQGTEATSGENDEFGQRYIVDFLMKNRGKEAVIRTTWIIRHGEDTPRLTSCYVL
jgi:hypothetical protein